MFLAIFLTSSRDNWLSLSASISLKTFAVGGESLIMINSTSKFSVAPEKIRILYYFLSKLILYFEMLLLAACQRNVIFIVLICQRCWLFRCDKSLNRSQHLSFLLLSEFCSTCLFYFILFHWWHCIFTISCKIEYEIHVQI